jgi:hypothetical protein
MEHGWMQPGPPRDENDKHRLILNLITRLRCPECNRLYDPEDFALMDQSQDVWVLGTRCRYCDEVVHVVVYMGLGDEAQPVVDLTPEELERTAEWPRITADDVLDIHVALSECDGDLQSLFAN